MQVNKSKSYLFLLIVLGLSVLSAVLYQQKPFNYGLDVKGGVRLVYSMDMSQLPAEQRQNVGLVRSELINILENRMTGPLGVAEGTIQPKGEDQLVFEIPGFTDVKKAEEILSTEASLRAYWAKNVTTKLTKRRYAIDPAEDAKIPVVNFHLENDPTKIIKPDSSEYLEIIKGWEPILQGTDLKRAFSSMAGNKVQPHFEFSGEGANKMETWTRRVLNRGENLAFVLDNKVLSIAPVRDGAILRNEAFIEGEFDPVYVNSLVELLNAGALPVALKKESSFAVNPTTGKAALDQMITAGLYSFGIISLFLIVYYVFPGILAVIALCLYVLFTLTLMKLTNSTFSLAAIAGFILSVGIAVDANILVFERVKEELREGKQLMTAVELGFKRAFPAILDSNVCTIITSVVLANLGTGPVKGFASTLIMGVIVSFFTAITVTRSLLVFLVGSGIGANPKLFGLNRQWFGEGMERTADQKPLQIVNRANLYFGISIATIIPGIIFFMLGGFKPNVEFTGGYEARYQLPAGNALTNAQIAANLEQKGIRGGNVKTGGENEVFITVPLTAVQQGDANASVKIADAAGIPGATNLELAEIGPSVQKETLYNAIKGVIISTLLIIIFLAIRFGVAVGGFANGLRFGMSAVLAMVHDILVVIGLSAIVGYFMNWEVSALYITALLTVIGFSVHDTIVIFDRIRENLRKPLANEDFANLCNRSITQSFARSLNTSGTVILTLAILIAVGTATPDLKFFCLTMLVGILSGTYSSIFNAAPILYIWDRMVGKRKGEEHTLMAQAAHENARIRAAQLAVRQEQSATLAGGASSQFGQVRRRTSERDKASRTLDD